jgi:hypothetical protein
MRPFVAANGDLRNIFEKGNTHTENPLCISGIMVHNHSGDIR